MRSSFTARKIKSDEIKSGNRRKCQLFENFKERCMLWHHKYLEPKLVKQKIKEYNSDDENDGSTSESYLEQLGEEENAEVELSDFGISQRKINDVNNSIN